MNYEHEKGIEALKLCLNMHPIKDEELIYIGFTREDITQIKNGNKYLTEEQLYNFIDILRSPNMLDRPLLDWLNCGGRWALAGIVEPTFSINGIPIRAIIKSMVVSLLGLYSRGGLATPVRIRLLRANFLRTPCL